MNLNQDPHINIYIHPKLIYSCIITNIFEDAWNIKTDSKNNNILSFASFERNITLNAIELRHHVTYKGVVRRYYF
jgi:hypothetical protein